MTQKERKYFRRERKKKMVESSQVMVVNLSDEDDFYIKQEVEEIESVRLGLAIFASRCFYHCVIYREENISE